MKRLYRRLALIGTILVCVFVLSMIVGAWVCSADTTPTVNVNKKIEFSIPATASLTVDPNGTANTALSTSVKCNTSWTVSVLANHVLTNGTATIPTADFTLTTPTVPGGMQFPTTAATCWSGDRGDFSNSTFTYKVDLTGVTAWWNIDAGAYTATHTYTATAL